MALAFGLEQLPTLLTGVEGGASVLNSLIHGETATDINTNNINNAITLQQNHQAFASQMNTSGQNFQQTMQQNAFAQQNTLQNNSFQQQNTMANQIYSNNLKVGGLNAGINLGTNLLSSAVNAGLSSALMNQQAALQRENFSFMTGQASNALQSQGLPSWLAYTGTSAMNAFPRTSQVVTGMNTFNSSLPGNVQSIPWQGTPSQISFGVGNVPTAQ